jgi:hypothetical protein
MKRNALLLFLALLLAAPVARGYDFRKTVKGNTLYFSILPGDSTVAVTAPFGKDGGWGDRAKPSGRLSIPAQVQQDGQRYAVVAVESGAFLECDALVAVTIPVSVSVLGGNSFGHCTSLRTVVFECDSLGKVYGAFSGCDAVDTIVLAEPVRKMAAFLLSDLPSIGNIVLRAAQPAQMKSIFFGCQAEAVLHIGRNVGKVPDFLCYNFPGLKRIEFEDGAPLLEAIGESAFVNCTGLTDIVLPQGLKQVGAGAFAHCSPLSLTFLPVVPPTVPASAFLGVDKGVRVVVPCASADRYAATAVGRHFENLDYDGICDDTIDRLRIIYIHDTIVVHDTVYIEDGQPLGTDSDMADDEEPQAGDDDGEVEEKPWIFIDGKILRIARATTMRGVGVRVFDEKGHLVVDEQIPHDQPVDNYYIKLPKKQRYFLRFDMGAPHVVDVERQEVR